MKIILKNNKYIIKDDIYGVVSIKHTKEIESFINECKKFKKNHTFGLYGIFQMTKKTNQFYSIYEDLITFMMFLHMNEYPANILSFFRYDYYYPFHYSMNFTNIKLFEHDINRVLLSDLYKYHMTIRLSVYYNIMTSQQIADKILCNFKLRTHNNQIYICHDSPIFDSIYENITKKLNDIIFQNKFFIAYNFLTKKILEDSILYGIITWKEITDIYPDTYYLEKIIIWAHNHIKNDICPMIHFLFVPDFYSPQMKEQTVENSEIIIWNEPYRLEYKPIKYLICSFTFDKPIHKHIMIENVKKTPHDNFFIYYNYNQ